MNHSDRARRLSLVILFAVSAAAFSETRVLKLATTTSTENSGLLDAILPRFEQLTGFRVDVIAVGTGRALKYGETGDVDCVLVHSPAAEEAFVRDGFGIDRRRVMHNDFVIVGPVEDPANVRPSESAADAMKRIAAFGAVLDTSGRAGTILFVSRGDESGTHDKERSLWAGDVVFPRRGWYLEAGQGMAQVLVLTSEKRAYTLADRGTYLALRDRLNLVVLFEGDPLLYNPYSVIAVNPAVNTRVDYEAASAFISWLVSRECQELIRDFRLNGEQLFFPDAMTGT